MRGTWRYHVAARPVGDAIQTRKGISRKRFGIPPFSTLNAREGWWQDRKRAWIGLGIESELGRGDDGPRKANGKTAARTFGQDLMRKEHVVGTKH